MQFENQTCLRLDSPHGADQATLELVPQDRHAVNLLSLSFSLWMAGISGFCPHTQFGVHKVEDETWRLRPEWRVMEMADAKQYKKGKQIICF